MFMFNSQNGSFEILDQTTFQLANPKGIKCKDDEEVESSYTPSRVHLQKTLEGIKKVSQMSGFTLTFKPKYHNEDDILLHRNVQYKLLRSNIWKKISYILIPEFTSKKGQLHYHGIIWNNYDTSVMKAIKWWRRIYGYAKPELRIRSRDNWIRYICKDFGKTGLWAITNIRK